MSLIPPLLCPTLRRKVEGFNDFLNAPYAAPDAPADFGVVYTVRPAGGHLEVLHRRGETASTGVDFTPDLVKNNRVVIAVEGIGGDLHEYAADWHTLFQSDDPHFANVGQPIMGIDEGTPESHRPDQARMVSDMAFVKQLEWGHRSTHDVTAADPAVKAAHDEVGQALQAGHEVLLLAHSGGGAVVATALHLLVQEDPHNRRLIAQNVRVVSLSGVASRLDYLKAGVQNRNLFYTTCSSDPIGEFGQAWGFHPGRLRTYPAALWHVGKMLDRFGGNWHHELTDILAANFVDGQQQIRQFINGGPGGMFIRTAAES